MNINAHPGEELRIEYAAGSLSEPMALLVATHVSLCASCRAEMAGLETLGGILLDTVAPIAMNDDSFDAVLARLDDPEPDDPLPGAQARGETGLAASASGLPKPLSDYVDRPVADLKWKSYGSLSEVALLPDFPGYKTRLLRIRQGAAMPRHTHGGTELTLVLAGGFSDDSGHYARGDVATADPSVDHRPIADPGEDCYCLAVTDAPLRLTGPVGRLFNFMVRY